MAPFLIPCEWDVSRPMPIVHPMETRALSYTCRVCDVATLHWTYTKMACLQYKIAADWYLDRKLLTLQTFSGTTKLRLKIKLQTQTTLTAKTKQLLHPYYIILPRKHQVTGRESIGSCRVHHGSVSLYTRDPSTGIYNQKNPCPGSDIYTIHPSQILYLWLRQQIANPGCCSDIIGGQPMQTHIFVKIAIR